MKNITLTECTDPERKIGAIKELRAATGLGLKDSKDIVDALTGGEPQTVAVYNDASLKQLATVFSFMPDEITLPAGDVLDFLFDVLSYSDPTTAKRLQTLPSYQRITDALR